MICLESNFIHRSMLKCLWLALVAFSIKTCFLSMAHDTCLDTEKRGSSLPSTLTLLQHLHRHPYPVWQVWRTSLYSLQCSLIFEMFPEPRVCLEHPDPLSFLSDLYQWTMSGLLSLLPWKWKWSRVQLFATPWTVAYQASQSMGFSRQEYWSGLPFPSPGDLPDPGIEPGSPTL